MKHREATFASLTLALGVAGMAGLVSADAYAYAARAEAAGYQALFRLLGDQRQDRPLQAERMTGASLVAANEVTQ
jgi:hypothetical protein